MTDKARYEASKQYDYHSCRIVHLNGDGLATVVEWFRAKELCLQRAETLSNECVMFQVEL